MTTAADDARHVRDQWIADLVRTGTVRIAMQPPQYARDATTGELRGWAIDLASALAARLGVQSVPIECRGPDEVLAAVRTGASDAGFLPNSPSWADAVDFSDPFLQLDFTFLVPARSPIRHAANADRSGIRIAVVNRHASTLALVPILHHAIPVFAETLDGAFDLLRNGQVEAFASTRPQLIDDSARLPGSCVLEDRYGVNFMSLAIAMGRSGWLAYLNEFIHDTRTSGLVQDAIDRSGWRGVRVPSG